MIEQTDIVHLLSQALPFDSAQLVGALMVGMKPDGLPELVREMKALGTYHMLVASGSNTALLVQISMAVFRLFGKKASILLTMPLVLLYAYMIRYEAPILRSSIMGILTLVAKSTRTATLPLLLLLISAIVSIFLFPDYVSSLSFLLSYSATFGIILGNAFIPQEHTSQWNIQTYLRQEVTTSFFAQLFTFPFQFVYFQTIPIFGIVAGVAVTWLIAPIIISGLILCIITGFYQPLSIIPSSITHLLSTLFQTITHLFGQWCV